MLFINLTKEII